MNQESMVLATDMYKRVRIQWLKGLALKSKVVSQEDFKDYIRYNAVSDCIIADFTPKASMEEFCADEDLNKRVASLEGILDSLKNFIGAGKRQAIEAKKEEADDPFWNRLTWFQEDAKQLLEDYEQKVGTITIPRRYAPFLNANDLGQAIKSDTVQYKALFTKCKPTLDKSKQFLEQVESKFSKFIGNADKLEEFIQVLKELEGKQFKGLSERFQESPHKFLGFNKKPFLSGTAFFYMSPKVHADAELVIHYPTNDKVESVFKELTLLCALYRTIDDYSEDYPMGVDPTDPPYRGYLSDSTEVQQACSNALYTYDVFDDNNRNFLTQLTDRMSDLINATIAYLEYVLK